MFIFTILPELFVHLIFGLGIFLTIVGFFLSFIPFISTYKLPIKIIGFIVLVFGIYLEGGLANNKEWELKVKEVEAQVAKAETESANLNTQLQAVLSDKKQVIKEKGNTIIKYVDKFVDKEILKEVPGPERVKIEKVIEYIENCPVPKELLEIHNNAATLNKGDKK